MFGVRKNNNDWFNVSLYKCICSDFIFLEWLFSYRYKYLNLFNIRDCDIQSKLHRNSERCELNNNYRWILYWEIEIKLHTV